MYIITVEEAKKHIEPRKLASLKVMPASIVLEPGQSYTFSVNGYDQHNSEFPIEKVFWSASEGTISEKGLYHTPNDEGVYKLTAKIDSISGTANVTISKKSTTKPDIIDEPFPPPPGRTNISWSGEVPNTKWSIFYSKVLARLSKNAKLRINVSFEIEDDVIISEQTIQETRTALKELGLNDDL
jgi:plastocyanin